MSLRFVVLGLDHRHAYGMAEGMIGAGAELAVFWTKGTPQPLDGFVKRFPDAPRAGDLDALLSDGTLDLALIAARPDRRADLAIRAMEAGLDVMVDKPGCIDMGELGRLRDAVAHQAHLVGELLRAVRRTPRRLSRTPPPRCGKFGMETPPSTMGYSCVCTRPTSRRQCLTARAERRASSKP